jgi:hypothetical protein
MPDRPPNQVLNESIVEAIFDLTLAVVVFFIFVIWRQCDQRQTGSSSLLRLNHRERDCLGFPRRDDAVRELEMREGFAFSSGT